MTKVIPRQQHKRSTLSNTYVASALIWDAGMVRALEACIRQDMTVKATMARLGVSDHSLARGAMLRLKALLPPEGT
jgi:hypothetical protein